MRGDLWWIRGGSVVFGWSKSDHEKHANFLKYFCGFPAELIPSR
jgi:hypothetical protein